MSSPALFAATGSARPQEHEFGRDAGGGGGAAKSISSLAIRLEGGEDMMRIGQAFHRGAQTYLVHVFGRGLEGIRYVIEKYRSDSSGHIHPVEPEQAVTKGRRRKRRTIMGAVGVKNLRPERDEIIVCTALNLRASGIQLYGLRATGLAAARHAC